MRDDFSRETADILAKRVAVRCSNPSCRRVTTGPRSDGQRIVNIGVAAHITAASALGPRFDASLTAQQRRSLDNGIWLCQNCAKLVDNDPTRFSVEVLHGWKGLAESSTLAELDGSHSGVAPPDDAVDLSLSYRELRISPERHDYRLEISISNLGNEPIVTYHVDIEIPAQIAEQPRTSVLFVPDRSSKDVAFFRASNRNHRGPIYPGDTMLVATVEYFVDSDIFSNRGELFQRLIRATLFLPGFRPVTVERSVEDSQVF